MINNAVTDNLFTGNVTVNATDSSRKVQSDGALFSKVMADANAQTQSIDNGVEPAVKTQTVVENTSKKPTAKLDEKTEKFDQEGNPEKAKDIAAAASDGAKEIKDKIKSELDVSDEDITNAMENLGLVPQNLLNMDSLKELLTEVSGVTDSMELLTNETLYQGMQEVLNTASEIVNSITENFDITKEDFTSVLDNQMLFTNVSENEVLTGNLIADGVPAVNNEVLPNAEILAKDTSIVDDNKPKVNVEVVREDSTVQNVQTEKTETFRNVAKTQTTDDESDNQNLGNMTQTQTKVTVNELGQLVETVERFTEGYSNTREVISQVTDSIRMNISADTTSMEMQLHPASLGTVNVQISSQNGAVTAHILVQNEAVKAALDSQMVALIETFEERGQQVEAVEVSVANYNLDKGTQSGPNDQERENALRAGKVARRRLRLDDMDGDDLEELSEEEKISADMMRRQGNSVDFMA